MASCVRNICAKNYQNLIIDFQVTVENVGMFFGTQCIAYTRIPICTLILFPQLNVLGQFSLFV